MAATSCTDIAEPVVVETEESLLEVVEILRTTPFLAIDTESNGFYAYFEKICLIQISTEKKDYIIDPLALDSLQPLDSIFSDPVPEKIFHAAANDLSGLKRDFGFRFANIFDTAVACKMLGCRRLGLATILNRYFGVELNKKWQRCNWGRRPLSREQITYASLDTHYLIPLRQQLAAELKDQDLWEQARQAFSKLCDQEFTDKRFNSNGLARIRGASRLDDTGRQVLRALYEYRDRIARRQDRAPFRIISNEALVRLAAKQPQTIEDLLAVKGLPRTYRKRRRAKQLLRIIRANASLADSRG